MLPRLPALQNTTPFAPPPKRTSQLLGYGAAQLPFPSRSYIKLEAKCPQPAQQQMTKDLRAQVYAGRYPVWNPNTKKFYTDKEGNTILVNQDQLASVRLRNI